jgi:hypothetical protein
MFVDCEPTIESDIPLPKRATDAMPELSPQEELDMRARTIKLLTDLAGTPLAADDTHIKEAENLARQMMTDPASRPQFAKYPNETMAYLAGMVAQSNCMLVSELSDLKLYVVNKLVYEVEHAQTTKDRLVALRSLGEIDGVDAFKRRSEMTIQVKPIEEVEQELLSVLNNIEYAVVEPKVPNAQADDVEYVVDGGKDNHGVENGPDEA